MKKVVFAFVRANPVSDAHEAIVKKVAVTARSLGASPRLYLSHTHNSETDPLTYPEKLHYVREAFGNIVTESNASTIVEVLKNLESEGFDQVTFITSSDKLAQMRSLLETYNHKEYNFSDVTVIAANVLDPDTEDDGYAEGSARLRMYVATGETDRFLGEAPQTMSLEKRQELLELVGSRLTPTENEMAISDLNKRDVDEEFENYVDDDATAPMDEPPVKPIQEVAEVGEEELEEEYIDEEAAEPSTPDDVMAGFAASLLHARTIAHLMHLAARKYAMHVALKAFYDALPVLVDSVVESYQGKYGMISNYPSFGAPATMDPIEFLTNLNEFVADTRKDLPQDSELQNDIDAIVTLINSTLYKLKYLA